MLLDGSDGRTSRALQEQLPEVHCLAPNVAPETQQNLEKLPNCTSWCGRIEDMGLHFVTRLLLSTSSCLSSTALQLSRTSYVATFPAWGQCGYCIWTIQDALHHGLATSRWRAKKKEKPYLYIYIYM